MLLELRPGCDVPFAGCEGMTTVTVCTLAEAIKYEMYTPFIVNLYTVNQRFIIFSFRLEYHPSYQQQRHASSVRSGCREGAADAPYVLMAGFPPAPLTEASQTLEQAGLKGASITQKLV